MKLRTLILALTAAVAMNSMAFDKAALADSLNAIAHQDAYQVGNVKVTQIKESNGRFEIRTNSTLGYLSITPELLDSLKAMSSRVLTGKNGAKVVIYSDDDELSTLITNKHKARTGKNAHHVLPAIERPLIKNASRAYEAPKGLDNRHIALYGSHGIYYHQGMDRWLWQRAKMFTTVEDLYTTGYVMPFLVPMLENAGAVVIQPRERDRQLHEVIVDDNAAQGSWKRETEGGWGEIPDGVLYEGENPFTFGGYSIAEDHSTLQYKPAIPEEGDYAVYISYKTLKNSTNKASYKVVHEGITTEFSVNQQMGGGTWVYVGTFHFGKNANKNYVSVSGKSDNGKVVTSDAIRFGGGYGSIARYPQEDILPNVPSAQENGSQSRKKAKQPEVKPLPAREQAKDIASTSGFPRWLEGARYWEQYSGIPDSVYNYTGSKNDYTDDYASRGRWVNWLAGGSAAYPEGPGLNIPIEMAMAFHTDAGTTPDNGIIGTLVIYTSWDDEKKKEFPTGVSRVLSRDFAEYIQDQMVSDIRATFAPEWTRRRIHNSSYAESRNPKVPTVLLEFLSHQNFADMKYGLDPSFRFVASRAIYKAMLRFNHEQYGTPYVVQPLPVQDFSIRFAEGNKVTLKWAAREDKLEETATPTYYVVYKREAGKDWDNGTRVKGEEYTLALEAGKQFDFKVCAGNEGGISMPSEVLTACKAENEKGKVLIVNDFTRVCAPDHFESKDSTYAGFYPGHYGIGYGQEVIYIGEQFEFERALPWVTDDNCGFGASYTNKAHMSPLGNSFSNPTMHGKVLAKMGYSFVSTSASAITEIEDGYSFVDIIAGKQKRTEIGTEMKQVKYEIFTENLRQALTAYKGNLLLSGAYIATDMASKEDKAFTSKVLHYSMGSDHASAEGGIRIMKTLPQMEAQLETELSETIMVCESPDGLVPQEGAIVMGRYTDSRICAAVSYEGKGCRQLIYGFPLESLKEFEPLYRASVEWLVP